MAQWFMETGAIVVERGPPGTMGPSTHAYGGTRMGDNRETNVVDRFGFAHEIPQPRHPRRLGYGHERRAQPDAQGPGAGLAHGGASGAELGDDREVRGGAWRGSRGPQPVTVGQCWVPQQI